MGELPSDLRDILEIPARFSGEVDKKRYIKESIIPRMEARRGRTQFLTKEQIAFKLNNPPRSDKPGEEHELARAITESGEALLSSDMALEIADVIYYSLQPNAPKQESLDTFLFIILGNDYSQAYDFCIVKYETRLRFGDSPEYKKIEKEAMSEYLRKLGY